MQPMHPQYFPGQPSSQYPGFPNISLIPPSASGISIPNAAISPSQQAPGSKPGSGGQKRKQVKNACVNCQKACKKCDEGRPCQRCIKYGLTDTCQDSTRKERKKGIKRGPYKRRQQNNQSANASASPSNVPLGNPMVTPQTSYNASPSMRGSIPFPYTTTQSMNQFSQGYEAMNHHYGYAPSFQKDHLMGQSYMAPPTIFPAGNPALTYHPMVPPQQPEILSRSASPSPLLPHNTFGAPKISQIPHPSQTPTPASSIHSPSNAASPNPADNDEDDSSKLAILSQLCSNVLDSNDQPKHEEGHHSHFKKRIGGLSNQTPPPSPHNAHTRTPSYDHDQSHSHSQPQVYHPSHNSSHHQPSHYTLNGHLSAPRQVPMIYGTPNSSPSSSPTDTSFSIPVNGSPKVSQSHQPPTSTTTSPQSSFWIPSSLPSLQSVVAEHYPYNNSHFQHTGGPHGQSHSGSNDWVGGSW